MFVFMCLLEDFDLSHLDLPKPNFLSTITFLRQLRFFNSPDLWASEVSFCLRVTGSR